MPLRAAAAAAGRCSQRSLTLSLDVQLENPCRAGRRAAFGPVDGRKARGERCPRGPSSSSTTSQLSSSAASSILRAARSLSRAREYGSSCVEGHSLGAGPPGLPAAPPGALSIQASVSHSSGRDRCPISRGSEGAPRGTIRTNVPSPAHLTHGGNKGCAYPGILLFAPRGPRLP